MNYYERHLGDYARDTGHLSVLEHGIYTLLLDRYYATEQGIPADQAHRLARARTESERESVDAVLSEFFTLTDGVWINRRVEEELAKANARINAARENGKKGGNPKKKAGYNERGYLYAVQKVSGGPVKVGITKHPAPRMSDLRSKNGAIDVLAMVEVADMGASEASVHRHFKHVLDGEWVSAKACDVVAQCLLHSVGLGTEPAQKFVASSQTLQAPSIHLTEPKGSGADAPLPEIDPIWHTGLAFLIHKGVPEKHARSFLGKLKSAVGDFAAGALLAQAEADDITDPVPWLQANSRTQGASNANSTPRIRVGLADRHPRPTFDENGAITGQAVRIDR